MAKPSATAAGQTPASNWERVRGKILVSKKRPAEKEGDTPSKKKKQKKKTAQTKREPVAQPQKRAKKQPEAFTPVVSEADGSKIVAMDCEMVGVGVAGKDSALARCSLVAGDGSVIYDRHVKPGERITDFRTQYSGVRARDLKASAVSLRDCQKAVADLLDGKLLVGHALHNDLKVLLLSHPKHMTRDTAKYRPLMRLNGAGKRRPRKLRDLAKQHLGMDIQSGEHSSVEDARAALNVYYKHRTSWESNLTKRRHALQKEIKARKQSAD